MATEMAAGNATDESARRTLAYEHNVSIELPKSILPARVQAVQSACLSNQALKCTPLDISISTDEAVPSGRIVMRVAPAAVSQLIDLASEGGEVKSRTTHAEDLAEPVADTERELAQLSVHRDRLTEFMKSKDIKIDQLITVSRELASVQSQLDSLNTRKANLNRRIDTELLTLNLSLPRVAIAAEQSQIRDAFKEFGWQFKSSIANVIRFIAALIPWLVIIVPGLFLLRLFWRWIGRRLRRREVRTAE